MSAAREASAAEFGLLWDAVVDGDYIEDSSDGHLLWAFLIDFCRQGASALFPGFTGAIVHAENDVGPTAAWLYTSREQLGDAWRDMFREPCAAAPEEEV